MPTPKQQKLAEELIENSQREKPLNKKALLEKVGYTTNVAESKASDIIESDGVLEALANLGFHEDSAKRVVAEILNTGEDNNRLKAADMIFKVQGSYAPEKSLNMNVNANANLTSEQVAKINQIALDD